MTFSIVARTGDAYGVAVASKFIAVGSVVPAARLGVGAIATQARAKVSYCWFMKNGRETILRVAGPALRRCAVALKPPGW